MLATPAGFSAALSVSHVVQTRVEVLVARELALTLDSHSDAGVLSGDITVDGTAQVRRSLNLSLADPDGSILPAHLGDLLSPPNEIKVWQGIAGFPLLPAGVFGISDVKTQDSGSSFGLTLTGYDRSRNLSLRSWTGPYVISRGTNSAVAIAGILANRDPLLPLLNAAPTTATTATLVLGEDDNNDPWKDAQQIAADAGLELYLDPDGIPVLRPIPDPLTEAPAATYAEGPGGLLLTASRGFSDDPGFNGIIVVGEGSEIADPYRVEVWDTNPASPTYYDPAHPELSLWGPRPKFIRNERILTAAQALLTAQAELRSVLGTHEDAQFTGVPHPGHEAGDVLVLRRGRLKLNARYVLDNFKLPLGPGEMTGQCRTRTVAA